MIFFSSLAFTVLENAMSVIFLHRVVERKRRFIFSVLIPYVYILSLGVGLLLVTLVAGSLQAVGKESVELFGREWSLSGFSGCLLYLLGLRRRGLRPHVGLPRHAGGPPGLAARADRRRHRGGPLGDHAPRAGLVLRDPVAGDDRLRLADDGDRRPAQPRDRRDAAPVRRPGHLRVRAARPHDVDAAPSRASRPRRSSASPTRPMPPRASEMFSAAVLRHASSSRPTRSRRPAGVTALRRHRFAGDQPDAAEEAAPERLRHRLAAGAREERAPQVLQRERDDRHRVRLEQAHHAALELGQLRRRARPRLPGRCRAGRRRRAPARARANACS